LINIPFINSEILAGITILHVAEGKIKENISLLWESFDEKVAKINSSPISRLPYDRILKYTADEENRRTELENKAKSGLVAITIAVGLIFSLLSILSSKNTYTISNYALGIHIVYICLVAIGSLYWLLGGHYSLKTLWIQRYYRMTPLDEVKFPDQAFMVSYLYVCLELNKLVNTLKTNYIYVSHKCIRNGLLTLIIIVLILICGSLLGGGQRDGQCVTQYVFNDRLSRGDYIYKWMQAHWPPLDDFNSDQAINIADGVYLINYIFKGGPAPVEDYCQ
jgi:hypothetical protein